MKKLLRRMQVFISRMPLMLSSLRAIYSRGGYATHTIATIQGGRRVEAKRILITGGGSGIGLAIAKQCIAEGGIVLVTGRDPDRLRKAALEVNSPLFYTLEWDVSKTKELSAKMEKAHELLGGGVDILVNNAGVLNTVQFTDVTEGIWDHVYSVNSRGLFFLTQSVCKKWIPNISGVKKIINISSQGGFVGATYPYRLTKWDVVGLTQGLGVKLAQHGIIVNGIAPGIIATDMQPTYAKETRNVFCDSNPIGRFAFPEEIAELAVFLMCDASNFIVGQTIVCDGGFSIK